MNQRWRAALLSPLHLFCAAWLATLFCAGAAEEAALLELWKQQLATPDDHETVAKACEGFVAANPNDPLIPVVRGLEAWHSFRADRKADALHLMQPYLSATPGPVNDGARMVALGWITRLDREQVAAALQLYYRKEIAYPKTLDVLVTYPKLLPAEARPPLTDRFGKPWDYRLTGFAKLPGFTNQKYALQSSVLGDLSDFQAALNMPYASRIQAVPVQVLPAPGNTVAVKFTMGGTARTAVLGLGQATAGLHLAFVGVSLIVVCDYTHWKVFPKP